MGKKNNGDRGGEHSLPRDGSLDDLIEQRPTCFVMQPFDKGKFDKRYRDAFEPALAEAGFEAYRVDEDPRTDVLIDAIEKGIREAQICLAEITTDNPNVWYELGFAYALGKPVILTCCDEERDGALPFDIRHRSVIQYRSESASDFAELHRQIVQRASAPRVVAEKQMKDADPIAPQDGLQPREIQLLNLVASETAIPGESERMSSIEHSAMSLGLMPVAVGLAIRTLVRRRYIDIDDVEGDYGSFSVASVTEKGWNWIEEHDRAFNLRERTREDDLDFDDEDSIPF